MTITSMTGFARVQGNFQTTDKSATWVWEIKSVNNKNLDIKLKLPFGYEEQSLQYKTEAAEILTRGSISAFLEITQDTQHKKVKIDEDLLCQLTRKAIELNEKFPGQLAPSSAAELLSQRGVIDFEDSTLTEEERKNFNEILLRGFIDACQKLQEDRRKEGEKIGSALQAILNKISAIVTEIEKIAADLPQKLKEKLENQIQELTTNLPVSEDRLAQEIVLLVTRADIREEIDRLKTHIKSAENLLQSKEAVGRRLDFLCQELNREANTTCSKAMDISLTNYGMDLKALIEPFREQVQNIE
ncbi:MAG: YicC family protein [Alphaproteobacteria bacterium]|nr:YicC family protein [Alphaproteobacteria bacterium]